MYDDNSRKYGALSYTVDCISVRHKNKPASVWQGECVCVCLFWHRQAKFPQDLRTRAL